MSATPLHKRPYNLLAHLRKEGRCKLKSFGAKQHRLEAIFIPRPFIILSGHLTVVHPSIYLFWGVTALLLDYQNGALTYAWLRWLPFGIFSVIISVQRSGSFHDMKQIQVAVNYVGSTAFPCTFSCRLSVPFDLIKGGKTKSCNFPIFRQSITIINFSVVFFCWLENSRQRESKTCSLAFAAQWE